MPDTRSWIVIGLFLETTFVFSLIALNPHLAEVQLFGALAMVVFTGLGTAVGYYVGSSKGSTDKDATIAQAMEKKP